MSTLITGAGLIGCHTARLLIEAGDQVVLLDSRPSVDAIRSILPAGSAQVETGDIRDGGLLRRHRVRRVLHTAAALSLAFNNDPPTGVAVNVLGTVTLLEACQQAAISRVVFGSSTTVAYSTFHQPHGGPIAEDFPLHVVSSRPGSLYAASKLAGEFFVHLYGDRHAISVGILRYSAVLGLWAGPNNSVPGRLVSGLLSPGADGRILLDDPLLLWSGGDDFIDVRDVAAANVAALSAAALPSRVYFIGSGALTGHDAFVTAARSLQPGTEIVVPELPHTGFAGFAHIRDQPFDTGAARRELGFTPRHDIRASL